MTDRRINGAAPKATNDMTFTPKHPFKNMAGDMVEKLDLRRFTVLDLEGMSKKTSNFEQTRFLIMKSTGLSPEEVDRMDAVDFRELNEVVSNFL